MIGDACVCMSFYLPAYLANMRTVEFFFDCCFCCLILSQQCHTLFLCVVVCFLSIVLYIVNVDVEMVTHGHDIFRSAPGWWKETTTAIECSERAYVKRERGYFYEVPGKGEPPSGINCPALSGSTGSLVFFFCVDRVILYVSGKSHFHHMIRHVRSTDRCDGRT